MLVQEAIRRYLLANVNLSAQVGTRIYPGFLSQGVTYPAIAYRRFDKNIVENLDEENGGHAGLALFQFRFFSTTDKAHGGYDTANQVDELIRLAIQGFKGSVTYNAETVEIQGIFHRFTGDGYDDETETFQVISDYDVWAEETKP